MTVLPDGRWRMSSAEVTNRVWEKLKNWRLDPSDDRCLIPNFPECSRRSLEVLCKPCGEKSQLGWFCSKYDTRVSVSYCTDCAEKDNNEPVQPDTTPVSESGNSGSLPKSLPHLLGT